MFEYYVVYSLRTKKGTGIGRTSVTTNEPIDSMKRIAEVEESILEDLRQRNEDGAENLFLTSWQLIKS